MKRDIKKTLVVVFLVVLLTCMLSTFAACSIIDEYYSAQVQALSNELSLLLLGNSAEDWNVFSVNPEASYGFEKYGEYSWSSYQKLTQSDVDELYNLFKECDKLLKKIKLSRLKGYDAVSYRYMDSIINEYLNYYGSKYAVDFSLIGSSIITSQGGYVASFGDTVDNYAFRQKSDVENLLDLFESTDVAFASYLDYMADREEAGYPLWDSTVTNMQDYLGDILEMGDNYYFYQLMRNKIKDASFLNMSQKTTYYNKYCKAIKDNFIKGVKTLYDGLEEFKGYVPDEKVSYLAAYGEVGKEYYKWRIESVTGIKNASDKDIEDIYNQLRLSVLDNEKAVNAIIAQVDALQDTNPDVYNEFYDYVEEKKAPLGLSEPNEIIAYMQTAAEHIVPKLDSQPKIAVKYMDDTVASISNTLAYYLKSPADQLSETESITINGHLLGDKPATLFDTMAHEGYPGHLYAYVNAKEKGSDLFCYVFSNLAFSEGWAMYASNAILNYTASTTDNLALQLYCQFQVHYNICSYGDNALVDILYNYMGVTEQEIAGDNENEEAFCVFRENPTTYIAYGYGVTVLTDVHEKAKKELGSKYNEVEFNKTLLSEGAGPTLPRAYEITEKFISSNK